MLLRGLISAVVCVLLCVAAPAAAQTNINALPANGSPASTDNIPCMPTGAPAGGTKRCTAAQVVTAGIGGTVPTVSGNNLWTGVQAFSGSNPGSVVQPVTFKNSATDAAGDGVAVDLQPSVSACAAFVEGYRDGGATNTGIVLSPCLGSTQSPALQLSSAGALKLPHLGAGILQSDSSGNIASANPIGTSGATVPLLNGANTWSGGDILDNSAGNITWVLNGNPSNNGTIEFPIITDACAYGSGIVGARIQTQLQILGCGRPDLYAGTDEVAVIDAFGYSGHPEVHFERYDRCQTPPSCTMGVNNGAVQSGETIGGVDWNPYDGTSDATTAAWHGFASETQVNGSHHGTQEELSYTPNANGASVRCNAMWVSQSGNGGISFGDAGLGSGNNTGTCSGAGPNDEGNGQVNAYGYWLNSAKLFAMGTWTPTLAFAGGGGSVSSYTVQSGTYVCVQGLVTVDFNVAATLGTGGASGDLVVGGLNYDFADGAAAAGVVGSLSATFVSYSGSLSLRADGTKKMSVSYTAAGSGTTNVSASNVSNGSSHAVAGTFTYRAGSGC